MVLTADMREFSAETSQDSSDSQLPFSDGQWFYGGVPEGIASLIGSRQHKVILWRRRHHTATSILHFATTTVGNFKRELTYKYDTLTTNCYHTLYYHHQIHFRTNGRFLSTQIGSSFQT